MSICEFTGGGGGACISSVLNISWFGMEDCQVEHSSKETCKHTNASITNNKKGTKTKNKIAVNTVNKRL